MTFPLPAIRNRAPLNNERLTAIIIDIYAGLNTKTICAKHRLSNSTLSLIRNGKLKASEVQQIVSSLNLNNIKE